LFILLPSTERKSSHPWLDLYLKNYTDDANRADILKEILPNNTFDNTFNKESYYYPTLKNIFLQTSWNDEGSYNLIFNALASTVPLDDRVMELFSEALTTKKVTDLKLRNMSASVRERMPDIVRVLLESNKALTSINLFHNRLEVTGATAIAEALKLNKTLTSINLADNRLQVAGATAISEALKINKTLTSIDLYYNGLQVAGATVIAAALESNKTLTSISLSSNELETAGTKAIAAALERNETLTSIDLSHNSLQAAGAEAIAAALEINKTLTSINLSNNKLQDTGAEAIAAALKINKTLTSIDLSHNRLEVTGTEAIVEALKINKTLTSIDLRHSGSYRNRGLYSDQEKEIFKNLQRENPNCKIIFE
jgi:hypothetical protein